MLASGAEGARWARRVAGGLATALGVVLLHGLVLEGLAGARETAQPAPQAGHAAQVRVIEPEPPAVPAAAAPVAAPPVAEAARRRPRPALSTRPQRPDSPAAPLADGRVLQQVALVDAPAEVPAQVPAETPTGAAAEASTAAEPAATVAALSVDEPVPVYPTRMPPAFSYGYDLRRGMLSGQGEISLSFPAEGYEARLSGSVAGFSVIDWNSRGMIDTAGLAPVRFVDQRRGRSAQAANFQRQAAGGARITYSGAPDERPLPPGAQDRLSWMLQLAAIAGARPGRLVPGERIAMYVSGARGDADVWTFSVVGRETIETPLGAIPAVHLLREARKPRDTRAEIWIDASRHYLPVKARLSSSPDGSDAFELLLQRAAAGTS